MKKFFPTFLLAVALPFSVSPGSPSAKIDTFIAESLREKGVTANPPAGDEVFLKRIYLEIAGRLPGAAEAREFLDSTDPEKRNRLIDRLLASDDYAHNFVNYWGDLLRIKGRRGFGSIISAGDRYAVYVFESLRENKPYDQMVREIIAPRGLVSENGAVGFIVRDRDTPLDRMANAVRVFLGTRLECAQCHDDPFDDWTQMDFYQLADFSYGQRVGSQRNAGSLGIVERRINALESNDGKKELRRVLNNSTEAYAQSGYYIGNFSGRQLKLPHDYQYNDARPGDKVSAFPIYGETAPVEDREKLLDTYARWMTSPENPMFTRVIVNRLWERVMGVRIWGDRVTETSDDLSTDSQSIHPALFDYMVSQMIESGYDLKAFLAMLYKTNLYQRTVSEEAPPVDIRDYLFRGPVLRRVSAEQIWDSLVYMINPLPNEGDWFARVFKDVQRQSQLELLEALTVWDPDLYFEAVQAALQKRREAQAEIDRQIVEVRASHQGSEAELAQKLRKIGGDSVRRQIDRELIHLPARRAAGKMGTFFVTLPAGLGELEIIEEWKTLLAGPREGFRRELLRIEREMAFGHAEKLGFTSRRDKDLYFKYRNKAREVCRAGSIDLPAPQGHFLRKFGQSDRELIDNGNRQASLIHPLAMMNERTIDLLRSPWSPFSLAIAKEDTMRGKIEVIYLSLLARRPTASEWQVLKSESKARGEGFENSLSIALLNSREFLFIQ